MAEPTSGPFGHQEGNDTTNDQSAMTYLIERIMSQQATAALVKVLAVTNAGGITPVGQVDVQPIVNQIDGVGNAMPHGTLHSLPYFRLQGGANAIILDPQVGDMGVAIFCSRDISSAVANKGQANPGSRRRFDMADGCYLGGYLNGTPAQYIGFTATGIVMVSTTEIDLTAPTIKLTATNIALNGSVAVTGSTLTHNGVNVGATHVHSGVQSGGGNTAVPH